MKTRQDHNVDCDSFLEFCEDRDNDFINGILEKIEDTHCGNENEGVTISESYRQDATNFVYEGSIAVGDDEFRFVVESGNRRGTVVLEWGKDGDVKGYEPPKPIKYTMVPVIDNIKEKNPAMWKSYLQWKKEPWFQELIRKYTYDMHFEPTTKTEEHYRIIAKSYGLKIVPIEE